MAWKRKLVGQSVAESHRTQLWVYQLYTKNTTSISFFIYMVLQYKTSLKHYSWALKMFASKCNTAVQQAFLRVARLGLTFPVSVSSSLTSHKFYISKREMNTGARTASQNRSRASYAIFKYKRKGTSASEISLVTSLLHPNSFICVLGVRSQPLGGRQRGKMKCTLQFNNNWTFKQLSFISFTSSTASKTHRIDALFNILSGVEKNNVRHRVTVRKHTLWHKI